MKKIDNRVNIFDLPLFSSTKEELLNLLATQLKEGTKTAYIFTPNPEQLVQAAQDRRFQHSLQQADLLIPDGIGLIAASKVLAMTNHQPALVERIPGVEVVQDLLELARLEGYRVLLVGGRDYDPAQLPQENFTWTPGYENVQQPSFEENQALEYLLSKLKPEVVFVAFGAPWQEEWILNHRDTLEKNKVKIAMAVGGSFDMLTGKTPRAPEWVRATGGEWLYRLIRQPWRIKRQTRLLTFMGMTLQELLRPTPRQ